MIRQKNTGEVVFSLSKQGSAAASTNQANFVAPFAGYIAGIYAAFGQAGVDASSGGTDIQVDIKKNGTSIFNSAATAIVFPHAGIATNYNSPTYFAPSVNPPTVAKGDNIRLDVLQIIGGTGPTQPLDLVVYVVLARKSQSPRYTRLGSVGDND